MINYLDITERNIITFVIKDLIKMAQARYLDPALFKVRIYPSLSPEEHSEVGAKTFNTTKKFSLGSRWLDDL